MSVCRMGNDSDVYVLYHVAGHIECCGCRLSDVEFGCFEAQTEKEMLDHLEEHKKAGHKVPKHAIKRLRNEI